VYWVPNGYFSVLKFKELLTSGSLTQLNDLRACDGFGAGLRRGTAAPGSGGAPGGGGAPADDGQVSNVRMKAVLRYWQTYSREAGWCLHVRSKTVKEVILI